MHFIANLYGSYYRGSVTKLDIDFARGFDLFDKFIMSWYFNVMYYHTQVIRFRSRLSDQKLHFENMFDLHNILIYLRLWCVR